jgi:hypothetical protein
MDVGDDPGRRHLLVQVPEEPLKAVLHDARGLRRSPDPIRLRVTIEGAAEEGVKSSHMVHVKVGKEEMIDRLNVSKRQFREAPVAAIEEQPFDGLATVDLHEQSVIPAGPAKDTKQDTHG